MQRTVLCLLACWAIAGAQAPVKDKAGCTDSKVISRMQGCHIYFCENKAFDSAPMPLEKNDRTHTVEGEKEFIRFRCGADTSPLQSIRNAEAALKSAGYKVLYTDKYATTRYWLTAQSGPQWVYILASGVNYDVISVKTKAMEQSMQANAAGWAQQIGQTGRASIYGINFDTGKATIRPDSEPVLNEVATLLKNNATWAMMIAGHTDNVGAKDMNLTLSKARAESVITWLTARGIDRTRMVAAGFGDGRPLADNTTDDGKAKNRRVDLVKVY